MRSFAHESIHGIGNRVKRHVDTVTYALRFVFSMDTATPGRAAHQKRIDLIREDRVWFGAQAELGAS
ncbi:MAG TPA: hypothetical protein DIW43_16865 [Spongiibacteraceae bacterium]|nr:hypothetical protein [Spongiibacteraceae bacterium]HCS29132.1 hypothetical protein [Spongiibacteraceae bacterium]